MNKEVKDIVTLVSAFLSALYLALQSIGIAFKWLTPDAIDAWTMALGSLGALVVAIYGVYKNTYVLTKKGRKHRHIIENAATIKTGNAEEVHTYE